MRKVEVTRNLEAPRSSLLFVRWGNLRQVTEGGFVLSYPGLWHGGQERAMTSAVPHCRLRSL